MQRTVTLIAVLMLILTAAPEVQADFRQFVPRISDYTGFLTLDASYENQKNTTNGRGITSKDTFLRETLELNTLGYVYDPRFITFVLKLSAGTKQESFSIGPLSKPFRTMFANEYTFRMVVLPEHPYNLELFALRVEPLTRRAFEQSRSVAYSKGAIFRYKKKPYLFNAHYIDTTDDYPGGSYTTRKYGALGTYYKEMGQEKYYSYSGSYEHTTYSFTNGSTDQAALSNIYFLKTISLSSNVAYTESSQRQSSLSLSSKTMNWGELVRFRLPWNFTSDLGFNWNKNKLNSSSETGGEQDISSTTRNVSLLITHKLYSSLFTTYRFGYGSLDSGTGTTKTLSNTLGFTYSKYIPGGRLRSAISVGRTTTDRKGVQAVPNEPHPGVRVPGSFTLDNQDIDAATILVFVNSLEAPGQLIPLEENADYVVTPFGNTFQITIVNLPPQYVIPGTYDFVVSYLLNNAETKLRTTNLNYQLNFELFNDMFYPYYNYSKSRQKVLSGFTDQQPWDFTSNIFGFTFVKRPFTLSASYLTISSNVNPSRGWKAEATYVKSLTQHTQIQASANYSDIFYPQGTATGGVSYSDRLFGASASVQWTFPKHNMYLSLLGAYSRDQSLSTSNSYSLSSNYVWNLGKIYVNAGATASLSDSEFTGGKNRQVYQYYYFKVKRKLF
ncbi:MAG: hypothetical protein P8013_14090 [Candidatus Sulfobium sp.]|jgi:hypothetical protein